MSLSTTQRVRGLLKSAEFHLPLPAHRLLLRTLKLAPNPYDAMDDENRAIFIHIPKTAGSSVVEALFERRTTHIPLARYRAADPARFDAYFKFGFVRDPFDRLHSAFNYLHGAIGRGKSPDHVWAGRNLARFENFEAFVHALEVPATRRVILDYIHFRPQHHWVRLPGETACALDFTGRFERLEEDFDAVCERLGRARPLDHKRRRVRPEGEGYSRRMKAIVGDLYSADFAIFGYDPG